MVSKSYSSFSLTLLSLFGSFLLSGPAAHAQFNVTATLPGNAEVDVFRGTNITVTFNRVVNTGTINSNTFTVRGEQFGIYPGLFSFPAANVVAF